MHRQVITMNGYPVTEIAAIVDGEAGLVAHMPTEPCGPRASIDTRTLRPGDIFFAFPGETVDGHRYVKSAFDAGASLAIVERASLGVVDPAVPREKLVVVESTARALYALAKHHRDRFDPRVTAITGSNGKTTTKELAGAMHRAAFDCLVSPGNFNNLLGLPLTLLGLTESVEQVVLEAGISVPGEMSELAALIRPHVVVITNVNAAHVEGLGGLDAIAREKLCLANERQPGGTLLLNRDDETLLRVARENGLSFRTFGLTGSSDFHPVACDPWNATGLTMTLADGTAIETSLYGEHQARNVLAAATAAVLNGVPGDRIATALRDFAPPPGRFRPDMSRDVLYIDDTYNANGASTSAAIAFLKRGSIRGRRMLLLGDMLELGREERAVHRAAGAEAAAAQLDCLFLHGERVRDTAEAARSAGMSAASVIGPGLDENDLVERVVRSLAPGDCLVVKGSRGMRMERLLAAIRERRDADAGSGGDS